MKRLCITLLFGVAVTLAGAPSLAADPPAIPLQITPARVFTTLTPGKLLVGEIEVVNKSATESFELTTSVQDLRMTGLTGEFTYTLEESPLALHRHVRLSDASFTLPPGQAKKVTYQVLLPKSAPPGGYYGVLFVRTKPANFEGTGVAVSGQVGSLLLFDVVGDVEDRGRLERLTAQTTGEKAVLSLALAHQGRFDTSPRGALARVTGEVTFSTWYGKKVEAKPLPETFLLPEAKRVAQVEWKPPRAGIYRATVRASFGSHPPETRTVTLYYLPSRARAALIVFSALLAYLLLKNRRRIFPRVEA